jgi:ABC-type nitrate/sulfonate/bicarbonate transport system permease component
MSKKYVLGAIEFLAPITALVIWYFASATSTSFYFPPFGDMLSRFKDIWLGSGFVTDAVPSLTRMAMGYGIAAVGGIAVGTAIGLSRWTDRLFGPLVEFLRALPSVVLIPFGIVVFGVDTTMKVFVIALGCSFPVILNTVDGVRSVDSTLLDVARTFRFNRGERLWKVTLPSASPQIFAGLRASLSLALILMVVSEMIASTNGIGYAILQSQRLFAVTDMWAGILALGILGYVINAILVMVERRVLAWHRGYRASVLGQSVPNQSGRRGGLRRLGRAPMPTGATTSEPAT